MNILWVELLLMACVSSAVIAFLIYVVAESNKPKPGSDPPCADFRAGRAGREGLRAGTPPTKLPIDSPPDLA
jgi:hypothetical protein